MSNEKYIKIYKDNPDPIYIEPGYSLLPGTNNIYGNINFNVSSKYGENLYLVIFEKGNSKPAYEIKFPKEYKTGDMFTMLVGGIDWSLYEYSFRMSGSYVPKEGLFFNDKNYLLDPYANKVNGMEKWGVERVNLRSETVSIDFAYNMFPKPNIPKENLIIYEMHVRGFSVNDSNSIAPGTFLGIEEKIPYLKKLGINCIELMPIFEFDELQNTNVNPETQERLKNYWGYQTISFFAPKSSYAKGEVISELRHLINELHKNKMEIILDVVFNHTAEMGNDGPILTFRGIDNKTYYMLDENGEPYNYTGCGNTLNCNNSLVREFITDALKFWRCQYFIDGFRFDLASVMTRDENGNVLSNPPLLEQITNDPILADCKLIAEPWDAAGLYQLGTFGENVHWMEWNGQYRDTVRSFLRGDDNTIQSLMKRISGSYDIYGENFLSTINFLCCHDGFTLYDLFTYNEKHNEANGEENRDGNDYNLSNNCGVEGETDDLDINFLRHKMSQNALIILFMSKGIPMLLMGDECKRTQKGNNNAYCQDNEISWFDWTLPNKNKDFLDFTKKLIKFRKDNMEMFIDAQIKFHGIHLNEPDVSQTSRTLAWSFGDKGKMIYVVVNLYSEILSFSLPERHWKTVLSTDRNFVLNNNVIVHPLSSVILISDY